MSFPVNSPFFPNSLYGSIVQEYDTFFSNDISCLFRHQEVKICLANVISARLYRQQFGTVEAWMHRPLTQTNGQLTLEFSIMGGFVGRVKAVAV